MHVFRSVFCLCDIKPCFCIHDTTCECAQTHTCARCCWSRCWMCWSECRCVLALRQVNRGGWDRQERRASNTRSASSAPDSHTSCRRTEETCSGFQMTYVTLGHKTSHKSLGYICSNSQKYTVWVKIIQFSFMPKIIMILRSCSMKIFSEFLTVNIKKRNFWLLICIAKNLIWTTLKMIFSIFRFFCTFRFPNSCISVNYYPIITIHTSMEILFIQCILTNLPLGLVLWSRVSYIYIYIYIYKCNLLCDKSCIFSIITPDFSVTWSSEIIINLIFSKLFVLLYAVHNHFAALLFIIFYASNFFYGGWLM